MVWVWWLFVLLVVLNSTVDAQVFPPVNRLEVSVVLYSEQDPAVSEVFLSQVRERVGLVLRTTLGSNAKADVRSVPAVDAWLSEHSLSELTPVLCRSLGCDQSAKTIFVRLTYDAGSFDIEAAEFDKHFDTIGRVQTARIVQRSMVREAAGRMALNCWTPVGEILDYRDGRFQIEFANMARLLSVPNWSRLTKGAVLQLYRETISGNQLRQDAHPTQFLTIDSVSPRGVTASPVGSSWDQNWFQYVGDARARYFVRRVAPRSGQTRVQVMISGTVVDKPQVLVPRGGCDVYLHDQPPTRQMMDSDIVAVTDRDGLARFQIDTPKPVFLTVAYENQSITQPFVPGISPEPVKFQFQYLGNQSDYLTRIASLHDSLRANAAVINSKIAEISTKAKDVDDATIRRLGQEAIALAQSDDLIDQVDSIERQAAAENLDVSDAIRAFRTTANDLIRQTNKIRGDMMMAETFAAAERALESIQGHHDAFRWDQMLSEMEDFARKYPEHPQVTKLPEIRNAVQPKDAEHAAARNVLADAENVNDIKMLTDKWPVIRHALDNLFQNNDSLYLANVNVTREKWMKIVNAEIDSLKADNVAAAALTGQQRTDAAAKLKARVAALKPVGDDLKSLGPRILAEAKKVTNFLKD